MKNHTVKVFEVIEKNTVIPYCATQFYIRDIDKHLIENAGAHENIIIHPLTHKSLPKKHIETLEVYIKNNFNILKSGEIIDIEFLQKKKENVAESIKNDIVIQTIKKIEKKVNLEIGDKVEFYQDSLARGKEGYVQRNVVTEIDYCVDDWTKYHSHPGNKHSIGTVLDLLGITRIIKPKNKIIVFKEWLQKELKEEMDILTNRKDQRYNWRIERWLEKMEKCEKILQKVTS